MPSGKRKRVPRVPEVVDPLRMVNGHAAGVDAHAAEHFVCVPAAAVPAGFVNPDPQLPPFVRRFGTNTCSSCQVPCNTAASSAALALHRG